MGDRPSVFAADSRAWRPVQPKPLLLELTIGRAIATMREAEFPWLWRVQLYSVDVLIGENAWKADRLPGCARVAYGWRLKRNTLWPRIA
jgi:hypothetical protein